MTSSARPWPRNIHDELGHEVVGKYTVGTVELVLITESQKGSNASGFGKAMMWQRKLGGRILCDGSIMGDKRKRGLQSISSTFSTCTLTPAQAEKQFSRVPLVTNLFIPVRRINEGKQITDQSNQGQGARPLQHISARMQRYALLDHPSHHSVLRSHHT